MNWEIIIQKVPAYPPEIFTIEDERLNEAVPDTGTMILWESDEAIVAPQHYARLPIIAPADDGTGWPCYDRRSGGGPVPIGPGVLNLSMILGWTGDPPSPAAIYTMLCDAPLRVLRALGCEPVTGAVDGSYCDGAHNLVVAGRKIAGTAQRRKFIGQGPNRRLAIAGHMTLLVDADIDLLCSAVNHYLRHRGLPDEIRPDVHINLAQCAVRSRPRFADVADMIAEALDQ